MAKIKEKLHRFLHQGKPKYLAQKLMGCNASWDNAIFLGESLFLGQKNAWELIRTFLELVR